MSEPNWVDRRAKREENLHAKAADVWNEIRAAIQDACDSFNMHYGDGREVTFKLENGGRIFVSRSLPGRGVVPNILVVFDSRDFTISVRGDDGNDAFTISSDEEGAFPMHGSNRVTTEEISQKILGSILTTENTRRRPLR